MLWPADAWDAREQPLPLKSLYAGAAGVIWALDTLRRRGHAETSLDLDQLEPFPDTRWTARTPADRGAA